jgi:hypothetical protein
MKQILEFMGCLFLLIVPAMPLIGLLLYSDKTEMNKFYNYKTGKYDL